MCVGCRASGQVQRCRGHEEVRAPTPTPNPTPPTPPHPLTPSPHRPHPLARPDYPAHPAQSEMHPEVMDDPFAEDEQELKDEDAGPPNLLNEESVLKKDKTAIIP